MERNHSVDVLRGIAAMSVAWFHFTQGQPLFLSAGTLLKSTGSLGYLGVSAFFVISGFVIPLSMGQRDYHFWRDAGRFALRRVIRLEPTYFCSIVVALVLGVISALLLPQYAKMPSTSFAGIALHIAYLAPWFNTNWILPVYWSLAIEFQYYFLMLIGASLLLSRTKIATIICLILVMALSFVSKDHRLLFCYLPLFGMGFCLFLAQTMRLRRIEAGCTALVFSMICSWTLGGLEALAGLAAAAFILMPIKRPLPILSFLGAISYSLYLIHGPIGGRIINLAARLPATLPIQLAALTIAVLASVLAAYLMWLVIERPTMRLAHHIQLAR